MNDQTTQIKKDLLFEDELIFRRNLLSTLYKQRYLNFRLLQIINTSVAISVLTMFRNIYNEKIFIALALLTSISVACLGIYYSVKASLKYTDEFLLKEAYKYDIPREFYQTYNGVKTFEPKFDEIKESINKLRTFSLSCFTTSILIPVVAYTSSLIYVNFFSIQ